MSQSKRDHKQLYRTSLEVAQKFNDPEDDLSLTWSEACRFAKNVGVTKTITLDFLELVAKWTVCSGPEWACGRVKSLKTALVHWYAHGKHGALDLPWFKLNRFGKPKGVVGDLVDYCSTERRFLKVVKLLNIATAFVGDRKHPTESQLKKFVEAVETPTDPNVEKELQFPLNRGAALLHYNKWLPESFPKGEDLLLSKPQKLSHDNRILIEWMWDITKGPARDLIRGELQYITDNFQIVSRKVPAWFTKMMSENGLYNYLDFDKDVYFPDESKPDQPVSITHLWERAPGVADEQTRLDRVSIGQINFSQEPGYKLRCYAAPHMWIQVILEPLKKYLMTTLKKLPWDMTHDQRKMDFWIQAHLEYGMQVYCYDLSNASDLIPLSSQIEIMRRMVPEHKQHYVDAMEWVSRQQWYFPALGRTVKWNRGQALGSGPSFGSFALWHGLLLWSLSDFNHDEKFFIVGDDVVILDTELAQRYEQALSDWKLPWSKPKTLQSSEFAEFTGMLFTKTKLVKNPKWKKFTERNFLDNLYNLGPRFLNFVPQANRPAVERFAALPWPLGFGWNPKGLSLEERLNNTYEVLLSEPNTSQPAIRTKVRINQRLHGLDPYHLNSVFRTTITNGYQQARLTNLDKEEYLKVLKCYKPILPLVDTIRSTRQPFREWNQAYLNSNYVLWDELMSHVALGACTVDASQREQFQAFAPTREQRELMYAKVPHKFGRVSDVNERLEHIGEFNQRHEEGLAAYPKVEVKPVTAVNAANPFYQAKASQSVIVKDIHT